MKKYTILILALFLTVSMLTACGCRNSKPMNTSAPTTMPTVETTTPATQQTVPTTRETIEDGNGPLPTNATAGADGDTSSATDDTGLGGGASTNDTGVGDGSSDNGGGIESRSSGNGGGMGGNSTGNGSGAGSSTRRIPRSSQN